MQQKVEIANWIFLRGVPSDCEFGVSMRPLPAKCGNLFPLRAPGAQHSAFAERHGQC
jgi:hypothetical protein